MLNSIANSQMQRACAAFGALNAREITVCEFAVAMRQLPTEVLQITGTIHALTGVNEPAEPRRSLVHTLCSLASRSRALS